MAYRNIKDFLRGTDSDKVLLDKAFNIAKNLKYDDYQGDFASMIYKIYDKQSYSVNTSDDGIENENMSNKELAKELELHKPVITKVKKPNVNSSFINKIWGADIFNKACLIKKYC